MILEPVKATFGELAARLAIGALIIAAILFTVANAWSRTPLSILRALESLPVYHLDRGPEHEQLKAEQGVRIVTAIQEVAGTDRELAALLLTVGHHESGWSLAIERTQCGPKECDRDRKGNVRSVSSFQLQKSATSSHEAWEQAKTDIRVATREAAFALKRARNMCKSTGEGVRGVFRGYAGLGCRKRLKDEEARMKTYERIRSKL